jgi:hypothetical protein
MKRPLIDEMDRWVARCHPNTLWAKGIEVRIARLKFRRAIYKTYIKPIRNLFKKWNHD